MSNESVIIKRKRGGGGDGHHGGAWKVAYADFVTSMMAFFMLLWILNATTEQQRSGLADFFDPNVPVSPVSGGGDDMLWGDSVYSTDSLLSDGHGGISDSHPTDGSLLEHVRETLSELEASGDVRLSLSPEGVVVDLLDGEGHPLFSIGGAGETERLQSLLASLSATLATSRRFIKITGHTDDIPYAGSKYTNWELSADRANAARRIAVEQGVPDALFYEVSGQADRLPVGGDRSSPSNRRISIILLNEQSAPLSAS